MAGSSMKVELRLGESYARPVVRAIAEIRAGVEAAEGIREAAVRLDGDAQRIEQALTDMVAVLAEVLKQGIEAEPHAD